MDVAIDIAVTCPDWLADLPEAETVAQQAAITALQVAWPGAPAGVEVSVALADDAAVRDLNRQYRGKDRATNVLSFASDDGEPAGGAPWLLGDVILAHGVVKDEAAAQGKTLAAHLSHLVVHGVLHLLGHDHEDAREAEQMETLETAILARLGIVDPYHIATNNRAGQEQEVAKA